MVRSTTYLLRDPSSATKFATVNRANITKVLKENGWREQERKWYDERESPDKHSHHIEWWNRGSEVILLYILGDTANVYQPMTTRRILTAVLRKADS